MKQKGFTPIIILVLVAIVIAGLFGFKYIRPSVSPLSTPDVNTIPAEKFINWKTHNSQKINLTFKYPNNFRVNEDYRAGTNLADFNILVDLNQTEGQPSRWISIYRSDYSNKWSSEWLSSLALVKTGGTVLSENANESQKEFSTWKRLSDVNIGGKIWMVFENPKPWEAPPPLRIYVTSYRNAFYIVETTYSDLNGSKAKEESDFKNTFEQILSTFEFTQ